MRAREREKEKEREISYNWNVLVIYAGKEGGGVCIWPAKIDFSREPIIYGVFERKVLEIIIRMK